MHSVQRRALRLHLHAFTRHAREQLCSCVLVCACVREYGGAVDIMHLLGILGM